MLEKKNCENRDFSEFDAMTTEELERFLRLDAQAPEERGSNTDKLLYVIEVLSGREDAKRPGKTAQEAWGAFRHSYLPVEDDGPECVPSTPGKPPRRWLRRLTAAAAVISVVAGLALTAGAFRWEEVWNKVAQWAKGTFSFVSDKQEVIESDTESIQQYTSIRHALQVNGHPYDFVPTWIPEEYELIEVNVDENPVQLYCIAIYDNGEKRLTIDVTSHSENVQNMFEKNDEPVEIYEAGGRKYYIFRNYDKMLACWAEGTYECCISGWFGEEDLKRMIDSIGKK